ncbi:MAG: DUF3078 domain-containing protein [Chitinophagaceae bacterium]|nr:DUF3078 domain-containing protein [Chitinophagaceae bacterium]HQV07367.1 DUF3078 domain-containing protein [Chitinophagaceae bacterium]
MKKITWFLILSFFTIQCFAQDLSIQNLQKESVRKIKKAIPDSAINDWTTGGIYNINAGQGSQTNWAAGGDDFSFSLATSLNLYAFYKKEKTSWDNALNLNFGYIKTSSLGSRKNDDRIDLISKYGYALNNKLNLTTLFNFRTQALKGYSYTEVTKGEYVKTFSSAFLSPAYTLISQGVEYKPVNGLTAFISPITSRWIIVKDDTLSAHGAYGITPGKHSTNQLGSFATISYKTDFNKFISYRGRIDLFSNYQNKPANVDLYMTNAVTAKLGKLIALSWNVDMIYDDDVKLFGKNNSSPALQLKSVFGIGLQVKI